MNSKLFVIAIFWAVIVSSCSSSTQPGIAKIEIYVTPDDGHAYCEFAADGWAEGGHESGGLEPIVHMNREKLPQEKIKAIWAAAEALDTQVYPLETSTLRECERCVDLYIYYMDEGVMHLSWPFGERHPDPKVQELETLLYEYNVGGW